MSENSYFGRKNVSLGLYARHYIFVVGLKVCYAAVVATFKYWKDYSERVRSRLVSPGFFFPSPSPAIWYLFFRSYRPIRWKPTPTALYIRSLRERERDMEYVDSLKFLKNNSSFIASAAVGFFFFFRDYSHSLVRREVGEMFILFCFVCFSFYFIFLQSRKASSSCLRAGCVERI